MNDQEEKVYCTRCGAPMKKSARCCLKCGNLNYLNNANDSMNAFMKEAAAKEENKTNSVPSPSIQETVPQPQQSIPFQNQQGFYPEQSYPSQSSQSIYQQPVNNSQSIPNNYETQAQVERTTLLMQKEIEARSNQEQIATRTTIKESNSVMEAVAFLICSLLKIVMLLIMIYLIWHELKYSKYNSIGNIMSGIVFPATLLILIIYANEIYYNEHGHLWLAAMVPVYNIVVLTEIAFGNMLYAFIFLIPIVGQVFPLYLFYKLGEKMNRNGFLSIFLFPIFQIIDGFGACSYITGGKLDGVNRFLHKGIYLVCVVGIFVGAIFCIITRI